MQCDSWHCKRLATAVGSKFSGFDVVSSEMLVLKAPCSGLVRYPLCYHNLQAADNNSHTGGCVRTPRSPQSPYCSLCLPAPVWGTTIQEQYCNFSPARLLGPGRKFQQHQHSELSRRGSAEHAHTGTRGCCAVSSQPSTGDSENVLPT